MKNQLFDSVIKLTGQRDMNSLEVCLAATLVELYPINSIRLLHKVDNRGMESVEERLSLTLSQDDKSEEYQWVLDVVVHPWNGEYQHLFQINEPKLDPEKSSRNWFPVVIEGQVVSMFEVEAAPGVALPHKEISGFMKIYCNYLNILQVSEKDHLTGLYNRRTFDQKLQNMLEKQKDGQSKLAKESNKRNTFEAESAWLAIIDIDHFKRVNDQYGHVCGDEVLLKLSQIMRESFRKSDLMFRFGGEEFVIVLEPMPKPVALRILDNFRSKVESVDFPLVNHVTVSIGVTQIKFGDYPMDSLENADKALYFAKENGRNALHEFEDLINSGDIKPFYSESDVDLF